LCNLLRSIKSLLCGCAEPWHTGRPPVPAVLRSDSTLAMPPGNQLNSPKTPIEFATSQPYGRSGSAALLASVIEAFICFKRSSGDKWVEDLRTFMLRCGKSGQYIVSLIPSSLHEVDVMKTQDSRINAYPQDMLCWISHNHTFSLLVPVPITFPGTTNQDVRYFDDSHPEFSKLYVIHTPLHPSLLRTQSSQSTHPDCSPNPIEPD